MNMCTVQSIKDAIRESCQSQYDMESTDIDRVLQTLLAEQQKQLKATVFFTKDCGFFHALKLERSEVNGRFSH